jgi:hypothetical protein
MITAVSVPASMLKGRGNVIGINAVTQRQERQKIGKNNVVTGDGDWVTVDRDGVPAVNNGLIPPARKDEYNAASTEDDAKGRFKDDIIKSLKRLIPTTRTSQCWRKSRSKRRYSAPRFDRAEQRRGRRKQQRRRLRKNGRQTPARRRNGYDFHDYQQRQAARR